MSERLLADFTDFLWIPVPAWRLWEVVQSDLSFHEAAESPARLDATDGIDDGASGASARGVVSGSVSTFKMANPRGLFTIGLICPGARPASASRSSGLSEEMATIPSDPPSAAVESMDSFRATSAKFSPLFKWARICWAWSRELTTMILRNAVPDVFWSAGWETCERRGRHQSPAHTTT